MFKTCTVLWKAPIFVFWIFDAWAWKILGINVDVSVNRTSDPYVRCAEKCFRPSFYGCKNVEKSVLHAQGKIRCSFLEIAFFAHPKAIFWRSNNFIFVLFWAFLRSALFQEETQPDRSLCGRACWSFYLLRRELFTLQLCVKHHKSHSGLLL